MIVVGQCVEQVGFVCVWLVDDCYLQFVVQVYVVFGFVQQLCMFFVQCFELLCDCGVGEEIDFFFGKIDGGFYVYVQCDQCIEQVLYVV